MVVVRSGFVLNSLVFKLLFLGDFLFFKYCMVDVIFGMFGGLVLIFNFDLGLLILGLWIGGGLFKIFLKCFVYCFFILFFDVISFFCLFLMGRFGDGLFFLYIIFVILYRFFCFFLLVVFFVFVVKVFMYVFLFVCIVFFICFCILL